MTSPLRLAISPRNEDALPEAQRLATELDLELCPPGTSPRDCQLARALLLVDVGGLALQLCGRRMPGPVSVDFGSERMRHRRGAGHNELLGRAVGIGRKSQLQVADVTAGLGRDGFVLADLGARVLLCERHPVVAALLHSGLLSAQGSADDWLAGVAARISLFPGDARSLPAADIAAVDVIYLDPMFPQRDKAAAVKKEMALFQYLLEDEPADEDALLHWALASPVARVVVKRPLKAPCLADISPSHSIRGKAVRYDVHVLSALA